MFIFSASNVVDRLIFFIAVIVLLCSTTASTHAQGTSTDQPPETDEETIVNEDPSVAEGTVSCFDYYSFGSVIARLSAVHDMAVPGSSVYFSGNIENQNNYPIIDASIYVKIFKVGDNEDALMDNGDDVVWQGFIREDIDLPAHGTKDVTWEWQVPHSLGTGEYRIATFVQTNRSYNLSGLTFTDDVTGPDSYFDVSGIEDPITWQKGSVTLNGEQHNIVGPIPRFGSDESVQFRATLENPDDATRSVTVSFTTYKWDALRKDQERANRTVGTYTIPAGGTEEITFEIPNIEDSVTYTEVTATDGDARSILNIRFARNGYDWPRLNFPALLDWPLTEGMEAEYFACLHNAQKGNVGDATVTLTVTDPDTNTVLDEYRYNGVVTGAMMAVKDSFTPEYTPNRILLSAEIEHNGEITDSAEILYDCQDIDAGGCATESGTSAGDSQNRMLVTILTIVSAIVSVLLIGLILWRVFGGRNALRSILLLCVLGGIGGGLFAAQPADAWVGQSSSWSHTDGYTFRGARDYGYAVGSDVYVGGRVNTTIRWRAYAERQGHLMQGDTVRFSTPCRNSDISWFMTGDFWDSPYGFCTNTLSYPSNNKYKTTTINSGENHEAEAAVGFLRPDVTITGSGSMSCSGNTCTATGAGPGRVTVKYEATKMAVFFKEFYYSDRRATVHIRSRDVTNVPSRTFTFNYNAESTNTNPNTPSLSCPSNLTTGQSGDFTFQGTDPDGDTIRYQIDWLNNGSYVLSPNNGSYVSSGSTRNESYQWNNAGTYTVRARTEDQNGATSGWGTCTVEVSDPPVVDLTADDGVVIHGESTTLQWDVAHANSCSASGGWSGTKSATGGSQSTGALTADTTYNLSCTGDGGTVHDSVDVDVETGTGASIENISCNSVVRYDSQCDLSWDVGTSEPSTCSILAGENTLPGHASLTNATGILSTTVAGETEYTLDCPGNTATEIIRVLPETQEI